MKALITGVSGQDGSYLSELLLSKGYEVYGMIRRHSVAENQTVRIEHLEDNDMFHTFYGDMLDSYSINKALIEIQPTYIYNLAAQSHVRVSFDIPHLTTSINANGVLNLLESIRQNCPFARLYQASSSEMFGLSIDDDKFQRETTPFKPVSPYGCAKAYAHNISNHYRRAYNLFISNGILFNHESPRRGSNFVTSKVVKALCLVKLGKQKELVLGNMDAYRDWGHSKDYVEAMTMILEHHKPDDFVVSTMETHSVRDMCNVVCDYLKVDPDCIRTDPKFYRAEELPYLKGDSTKIRTTLGWEPKYNFEQLMHEMCDHWLDILTGYKSNR